MLSKTSIIPFFIHPVYLNNLNNLNNKTDCIKAIVTSEVKPENHHIILKSD